MTPAPTPNKTVKKVSPLATLLAYIQRQGRLLAFITLDLFLDFYIYLYCIFRDKKIVERLFAYVQRQWHRLSIVVRWIRLMLTKDNLRAYLRRHWRLLALLILYIFFRPTFEEKLGSMLQHFDPSEGSLIVWLGGIGLLIALVRIHSLGYEWYLFSQKYSKSFVAILFGLWAYYHWGKVENYEIIPTPIPGIYYMDIFLVVSGCLLIVRVRSYREERGRQRALRARMKQATADDTKEGYQIDQPITPGDEDLLGRRDEAESLTEKIFETDTSKGAFTLGLTAPWGAGKTSFMLVMRAYLTKKPSQEVIVMAFNPWMYRKAPNLTQVFFEELSRTLAPYNSDLASAFIRYVRSLLAQESSAWLQLAARLLPQESNEKSITEQYESLSREIYRLGRKIFIFIDDVDRLEHEELVELFALVRNSSSFPNMSYILAYDKEYVASQLKGCFNQHTYRYMEKILQEEYPLAEITPAQIKTALEKVLGEVEPVYPDLKTTIITSGIELKQHFPTLRSIKRIHNALLSIPEELKGNVLPFDWFIIELIRIQYPLLFDFLKGNYVRAFDNSVDGRLVINTEVEEEGTSAKSMMSDHPTEGESINFSSYLSVNKELVPPEKVGLALELMIQLWGEEREYAHRRVNNWEYVGIYFYRTMSEDDINTAELRQYLALPVSSSQDSKNKIKGYVDLMLNSSRWLTFCDAVCEEKVDSLDKTINMLYLAFYMLSQEERRWLSAVSDQIDRWISSVKGTQEGEGLRMLFEDIFSFPDIRRGLLLYVSQIINGGKPIAMPFTKEELVDIQGRLFLDYVQDEDSIDPVHIYGLWSLCRTRIRSKELSFYPLNQSSPLLIHPEMDQRMRGIICANIDLLLPLFIQQKGYGEPEYRVICPEPIWSLLEGGENPGICYFPSFAFGLDRSSKIVAEFQTFLRTWLDEIDKLWENGSELRRRMQNEGYNNFNDLLEEYKEQLNKIKGIETEQLKRCEQSLLGLLLESKQRLHRQRRGSQQRGGRYRQMHQHNAFYRSRKGKLNLLQLLLKPEHTLLRQWLVASPDLLQQLLVRRYSRRCYLLGNKFRILEVSQLQESFFYEVLLATSSRLAQEGRSRRPELLHEDLLRKGVSNLRDTLHIKQGLLQKSRESRLQGLKLLQNSESAFISFEFRNIRPSIRKE